MVRAHPIRFPCAGRAGRNDARRARRTGAVFVALLVPCLLLLVPSARAQDPALESPARRLLHGSGGGVLRGLARWSSDHWDYQRAGRWEALAPGAVAEARLEADVLEEAGRRRAAVRRGTSSQRVEFAEWMFAEGLLAEAMELLDEVLLEEPDQPEALAFVRRGDLPFALPRLDVALIEIPEARAALLQWASDAPPALREVAIRELESLEDRDALRAELQLLLAGRSAGGRALAATALRRLVPRGEAAQVEVEELLRRAVRDVDPTVRRQASLALRDQGEEGVILPVVGALGSRSTDIRSQAAESLGLMGYPAAVYPLAERLVALQPGGGDFHAPRSHIFVGSQIAYVAGFDVEVATAAAIGNPEIGVLQEGVSLDVAVLGASSSGYAAEVRALTTALARLTGAQPGSSKAAWTSWWEQNRQEWMASSLSR